MLSYYLRLASKSFRRTPGLTALMVCAIALGIGACIVTLTVYHAMSGNPIWWKSNVLYAVTMDSWDPAQPYDPDSPQLAPPQLTYRDATYLMTSNIPKHKAIMTQLLGMLSGAPGQRAPVPVMTRATTGDFFPMFDVPFEYGGGWDAAADRGPQPVIVLSHAENEKLFGGIDSVGRTIIWNGRQFRIVGVLKAWQPVPRFYDVVNNPFAGPEDAYVPFNWGPTLQELPAGPSSGWGSQPINDYRDYINDEDVWIEMWVELPTAAGRARMLAFMNSYWAAQRKDGRFQRPLNNHLTNVGDWLRVNHVVSNDNSILVRLAFAFLAVCLINTVGILLAKFLRRSGVTGLLRALGASRGQLFCQHLVEVAVVATLGAAVGLALGVIGLKAVQHLYTAASALDSGSVNYAALAHFDPIGIGWALGLAALTTLAAGLYPAWAVGRLPPSRYLKSQ
ncbi:MAG: ABC transporter permease [Steroidobacteraceae bacterium]